MLARFFVVKIKEQRTVQGFLPVSVKKTWKAVENEDSEESV